MNGAALICNCDINQSTSPLCVKFLTLIKVLVVHSLGQFKCKLTSFLAKLLCPKRNLELECVIIKLRHALSVDVTSQCPVSGLDWQAFLQINRWSHRPSVVLVFQHMWVMYLSASIFSLKACSRWCARCGHAVWANFVSQWNWISFSEPCKENYGPWPIIIHIDNR